MWELALLIPIAIMLYGYMSERRQWNGGLSKKSGSAWKSFDTDSQGGRGYKDSAGNYVWISYPFITKES